MTGVGVMAPAVKQTVKTEVNPGLSMGSPQGEAAAIDFFHADFPPTAPLTILGGTRVRGPAPEGGAGGVYVWGVVAVGCSMLEAGRTPINV